MYPASLFASTARSAVRICLRFDSGIFNRNFRVRKLRTSEGKIHEKYDWLFKSTYIGEQVHLFPQLSGKGKVVYPPPHLVSVAGKTDI